MCIELGEGVVGAGREGWLLTGEPEDPRLEGEVWFVVSTVSSDGAGGTAAVNDAGEGTKRK